MNVVDMKIYVVRVIGASFTRELICIAQVCLACVSMSLFLTDPYEVTPVRAFYSSRSYSYNKF
jgi:hypothetical protein